MINSKTKIVTNCHELSRARESCNCNYVKGLFCLQTEPLLFTDRDSSDYRLQKNDTKNGTLKSIRMP